MAMESNKAEEVCEAHMIHQAFHSAARPDELKSPTFDIGDDDQNLYVVKDTEYGFVLMERIYR